MKALIISDLHSNIHALEAIWAQESDADAIYCAGDLLDWGPNPKRVVDWIREHQVTCVNGGHDGAILHANAECPDSDKLDAEERKWHHHNAEQLTEDDIKFIEELPKTTTFEIDGISYGMTHNYQNYETIPDYHDFAIFAKEAFGVKGEVKNFRMIFGHTHMQCVHYVSDDCLWLNPGSITYRRCNEFAKDAHYATIIDGKISLKVLEYDLRPVNRDILAQPVNKKDKTGLAGFYVE